MPSASGLVFCAVAVNAWWKFNWYVHDGYIVGKLDTNVIVAITDAVDG